MIVINLSAFLAKAALSVFLSRNVVNKRDTQRKFAANSIYEFVIFSICELEDDLDTKMVVDWQKGRMTEVTSRATVSLCLITKKSQVKKQPYLSTKDFSPHL